MSRPGVLEVWLPRNLKISRSGGLERLKGLDV